MDAINEAVIGKKGVRVIAYSVTDQVENNLKDVLKQYLQFRRMDVLMDPLYTILKELLINAVKANFKNIYFEDYKPKNQAHNIVKYETALKLFKLELGREEARHLSHLARKKGLKAMVDFRVRDNRLFIVVTNPVTMTPQEMENIHNKLHYARDCTDISEYLMNEEEDPHQEGAGLGLILITMILKSLGADEAGLSITTRQNRTEAALSISLTEKTLENYKRAISHPLS